MHVNHKAARFICTPSRVNSCLQASAASKEFSLDGETFLEVDFAPNKPLGLDLIGKSVYMRVRTLLLALHGPLS